MQGTLQNFLNFKFYNFQNDKNNLLHPQKSGFAIKIIFFKLGSGCFKFGMRYFSIRKVRLYGWTIIFVEVYDGWGICSLMSPKL